MEGVLVDVKSLSFWFPHLVVLPRTPQDKAVHWADQLPEWINLSYHDRNVDKVLPKKFKLHDYHVNQKEKRKKYHVNTSFPIMRKKHPQPLAESWNKKNISIISLGPGICFYKTFSLGPGICFYETWDTKQQENEAPHMLWLFLFPGHL